MKHQNTQPSFYPKLAGFFVFLFGLTGCFPFSETTIQKADYSGEFGVITVAGAEKLNPLSLDWQNRLRLNNIYESLVKTDENSSIEPSLAVSWGLLNDKEWEFYLRKGVKFQDSSDFNADDVIFSFDLAKNSATSELKSVFANIDQIQKIDDYRLDIKTLSPDPLFLNKIAQIFILNSENYTEGISNGTGAYKLISNTPTQTELEAFEDYWGGKSEIKKASFQAIDNSVTRQEIAITNDCQKFSEKENYKCGILTSVPLSVLDRLNEKLKTYKFSNLNSTYLVFNNNSLKIKDDNLKKALKLALDYNEIGTFGGELTYPANQFFSSGSFGHNPDLEIPEQNTEEANRIFPLEVRSRSFVLDYHPDYEILANYLYDAWRELGIELKLNQVSSAESLKKRTESGQNDFYIISWQVENGDAEGFFTSAVHTPDDSGKYGQFNWSNYGDKDMDLFIENSNTNMNWRERLKSLREISKFITETKPYGIPLFESKSIYAADADVNFTPRADGFIILSQISLSN